MPTGLPYLPASVLRDSVLPSLDHGVLSIPGRTSTINADLDRFQANEQRAARKVQKTRAAATNLARIEAKALIAQHQAAILAKHGARFGISALKAELKSMAHFESEKCVRFVGKFLSEQAAA